MAKAPAKVGLKCHCFSCCLWHVLEHFGLGGVIKYRKRAGNIVSAATLEHREHHGGPRSVNERKPSNDSGEC